MAVTRIGDVIQINGRVQVKPLLISQDWFEGLEEICNISRMITIRLQDIKKE